jgi:hypothetical protein
MKTTMMVMGLLALGGVTMFMPAKAQAYDEYCREYTRTVSIGNRQEVAYGNACYQPDGSWKIVDEDDQSRIGQRFRDNDVVNSYQPANSRPVYQPYHYRPLPPRTRIVFISDNDRHDYKHHGKHRRGRGHDDRHDDRHRHR